MSALRHGLCMVVELALRFCVHPRLRARCLGALGARIGRNVRIYECRLINLEEGFRNLRVDDDVHIGAGCLLDLKGPLWIGPGSTLSPRVCVITHADPGASHGSPLCDRFPPESDGVSIGEHCWIGTAAVVLSGAVLGARTVIGAGAVVKGMLEGAAVYAGVPARRLRTLE
ncbi:acyltransferase [Lysobacter humi (ex Lee et al. 2017)]